MLILFKKDSIQFSLVWMYLTPHGFYCGLLVSSTADIPDNYFIKTGSPSVDEDE